MKYTRKAQISDAGTKGISEKWICSLPLAHGQFNIGSLISLKTQPALFSSEACLDIPAQTPPRALTKSLGLGQPGGLFLEIDLSEVLMHQEVLLLKLLEY